MADETLKPKRSPVKAEENPPASSTRPPLKFIKETVESGGLEFNDGLLDLYHGGYFDDSTGLPGSGNPHVGPLTVAMIRAYAEGYHKSVALEAARLKREQIKKAQTPAQQVVRVNGGVVVVNQNADNPAASTCTRCKQQFAHLKTMSVKLCEECLTAMMEEDQATWEAEQQAKKDAERAAIAASRADWTTAQWDELRRKTRAYMNGPASRRARKRRWLTRHVELARERWKRVYNNPAAENLRKRLDAYANMWEERERAWRDDCFDACVRYDEIKADDCTRRNIHPKYRYCHNDGLPIPWDRGSFFCDDKCEQAVVDRGDVHVDTGTRCVCGALLITDNQPLIDALPTGEYGEVFHTFECLMSSPDIDEDDYKDFGPDAACWKPLLHIALVKPAYTFKERQKQIMSSPEKVLAMTGGPTAKLILENPDQAAALSARWMPNALPAASSTNALPAASPRRLALGSGTSHDDLVIDFVVSVEKKDGYVSKQQIRTGPPVVGAKWMAPTASMAALDRLVASGRLIAHPTQKNRYRLP